MWYEFNCVRCGKQKKVNRPINKSRPKFCSKQCQYSERSEKEKFDLAKISYEKHVIKNPGSECYDWKVYKDPKGYGHFQSCGDHLTAHRFSWEMAFGKIPEGMVVAHHCDTPSCSRVDHLFLCTSAQNTKDRDRKGRTSKGEQHHNSNFSNEEVKYIKYLLRNGVRPTDISRKFKVTDVCIFCIKSGKSWSHLLDDETKSFNPFDHLDVIQSNQLLSMLESGKYDENIGKSQ